MATSAASTTISSSSSTSDVATDAPSSSVSGPAIAVDKGAHASAASTDAITTSVTKASRASLSIHEKSIVKSYCEQRIDECKARGEMVPSQDLLRREVLAKFGWQMGRSTLSKILTMDWKALNVGSHRNPNMKRKRKPLFPDFEDDLVKYIGVHVAQHEALASEAASEDIMGIPSSSVNAGVVVLDDKPALPNEMSKLPALQPRNGHVLTEAIILEEAQRLKQLHGIKDEQLVLSVGWLARFKHRNGIRLRKASGSNVAQTHKPPPGLTARSATIPSELFEAPTASSLQHGSAIESTAPLDPPRKQPRQTEHPSGIAHLPPSSSFALSLSTAAMEGETGASIPIGSRQFWDHHSSTAGERSKHNGRRLSI